LTTTAAKRAAPAAPLQVPRLAPQRRRRGGLIALAVALVALGGLVAAWAITLVGSTHPYLAVVRQVQVGAVVAQADLTTVGISGDPALRPIPAAQLGSVVGKYAAVELVPGTLLTEAELSNVPLAGPGTNVVSIGLPQESVPQQLAKPGTKVALVATPDQSLLQQQPATSTGPPETINATIIDVRPGSKDGTVIVTVAVSPDDGPTVATLAAANRIAIVLTGG
jgi:hypothetical protein